MKIPVWRRTTAQPLMLRLTPTTLMTFMGTVGLLAAAVGAVSYAAGAKSTEQPSPVVAVAAHQPSDPQTQADQIKAMNERMAEMQAQLLRLDALGQHVAESAHIATDEFELDKDAKGGPLLSEVSMLGDDNIDLRLQELAQLMAQKEAQLQALDNVLLNKRMQNSQNYLANLPVRKGSVTSSFGYRSDPFTGRAAFHAGIDFSGPQGTDIYSVAPGVVSFAGVKNGYGNVVEVSHGEGYVTRYAHAHSVVAKVGDLVTKDQLIAHMGSTGRSTGTHLHYEVLLNGKQIDPATYISLAMKK